MNPVLLELFLFGHYLESSFEKKRSKLVHSKLFPADLDSPRRELSVRGFGLVVDLTFFWELICCVLLLRVQAKTGFISANFENTKKQDTVLLEIEFNIKILYRQKMGC